MLKRTCEAEAPSVISNRCTESACSSVRGRTSFQPCGEAAPSHTSSEQLSGKFPLKCEVSTSTWRRTPAIPSRMDHPIVARAAPAPGLPAVAHVRALLRHEQVLRRAEELVAAILHAAAVGDRREVDAGALSQHPLPIGKSLAVNAQPRHPAIGIDVKAQMGVAVRIADLEAVLRVAFERRFGKDLGPADRVGTHLFNPRVVRRARTPRWSTAPDNCP